VDPQVEVILRHHHLQVVLTLVVPQVVRVGAVVAAVVVLALVLVLFGLLLALQASQLRLRFEAEALVVLRLEQEIRRFPYVAWLGWRLFWSPLPVLFYFREERSIHLLPLLFDATALQEQLIQRLPPTLPSPSIGKTMPP
jgi:hypothetical protein